MNIKQHIEAGHYPKDDKGRALVPCRCGYRTATIAATDAPGEWIIQGWWQRNGSTSASQQSWFVDGRLGIQGRNTSPHEDDLLPPPPRKVKVTRWIILDAEENGEKSVGTWKTREGAIAWLDALGYPWANTYELVELSGDYEAVWS